MNLSKSLNTLKFVPLHLAFWVLVWLFYIYFFSFNSQNQDYVIWFSSILIPVTITTTYFVIYFLIPRFLLEKKYELFLLYNIYTFIGAAYLITLSMYVGYIFYSQLDLTEMPPLSRSLPFILISVYLVVFIVSAFAFLRNNYLTLEKNKTLENKFLQTQLKLKEEELRFLKMQIHPHFLFNTLNTLYGFALKKADETPDMILRLSNLLDYILYQIDKPFVLLKDEIAHLRDYISLEETRFRDSLKVTLTIDQNDHFKIAPMLLIPFVENAFKHGSLKNGILTIDIDLKVIHSSLYFKITNSTIGENSLKEGIGLSNSKKRLEMLYPSAHTLNIQPKTDYFELELKIENPIN